jgi:hypothetical protein
LSKCKKIIFLFAPISIVVIFGPQKYRDIILSKHSPIDQKEKQPRIAWQQTWKEIKICYKFAMRSRHKAAMLLLAQSFSPNLARDGRQTCRPAANFSVTKMQEQNSIIQSPCFFELGDKFVAHLKPN